MFKGANPDSYGRGFEALLFKGCDKAAGVILGKLVAVLVELLRAFVIRPQRGFRQVLFAALQPAHIAVQYVHVLFADGRLVIYGGILLFLTFGKPDAQVVQKITDGILCPGIERKIGCVSPAKRPVAPAPDARSFGKEIGSG